MRGESSTGQASRSRDQLSFRVETFLVTFIFPFSVVYNLQKFLFLQIRTSSNSKNFKFPMSKHNFNIIELPKLCKSVYEFGSGSFMENLIFNYRKLCMEVQVLNIKQLLSLRYWVYSSSMRALENSGDSCEELL